MKAPECSGGGTASAGISAPAAHTDGAGVSDVPAASTGTESTAVFSVEELLDRLRQCVAELRELRGRVEDEQRRWIERRKEIGL